MSGLDNYPPLPLESKSEEQMLDDAKAAVKFLIDHDGMDLYELLGLKQLEERYKNGEFTACTCRPEDYFCTKGSDESAGSNAARRTSTCIVSQQVGREGE